MSVARGQLHNVPGLIPVRTHPRANIAALRQQAVERVIHAMSEHLDEPLSLHDMADLAYMSPFHFDRVFGQVTGVTPSKFLSSLRLDAAKRLLLTTNLSVTEVCLEVGYSSLGTFTTQFTRDVGLSPRRLRCLADNTIGADLDVAETASEHPSNHIARRRQLPGVRGQVTIPHHLSGPIFVGLFPTIIPQGQPIACAFLTAPGEFFLSPVPEGTYYVLAATFRWSANPIARLIPEHADTYVGAAEDPLVVRANQVGGKTEIVLHRATITDPPILIALPFLLATQLNEATLAAD